MLESPTLLEFRWFRVQAPQLVWLRRLLYVLLFIQFSLASFYDPVRLTLNPVRSLLRLACRKQWHESCIPSRSAQLGQPVLWLSSWIIGG